VNWVENEVAPEQIPAQTGGGTVTRPLCLYPQRAVYDGTGNPSDAASFHAAAIWTRPRWSAATC
jgi:feruloyl esterase